MPSVYRIIKQGILRKFIPTPIERTVFPKRGKGAEGSFSVDNAGLEPATPAM